MRVSLILKKGASKPQAFTFNTAEIVIGRQKGCQVRIPDAAVSRLHCQLSWEKKGLFVEDLKSANGTYVNDEPVTERLQLAPGDLLQVGPFVFKLNFKVPGVVDEDEAPEMPVRKKKRAEAEDESVSAKDDETVAPEKPERHTVLQAKKGDKKTPPPLDEDEDEGNPDASSILDDRSSSPSEGDLRNLLSQMDDE